MATTREVICPSGLRIEVRGMKIKEANALADAGNARKGTTMDQLLTACTVGMLDAGQYPFPEEKIVWPDVLLGDRFAALMGIRIQTHGPLYGFGLQCSSRVCKAHFEWQVDLEKDLTWKEYDREALASFFASKSFPIEMPDGKAAELRFLVGRDERDLAKGRKDKVLSEALGKRIVSISETHPNDRMKYIENLGMGEARELLAALDQYDGGVDTTIGVECPECGQHITVDLPFESGFWMPKGVPQPRQTPLAPSSERSPRTTSGGSSPSSPGRSTAGRERTSRWPTSTS